MTSPFKKPSSAFLQWASANMSSSTPQFHSQAQSRRFRSRMVSPPPPLPLEHPLIPPAASSAASADKCGGLIQAHFSERFLNEREQFAGHFRPRVPKSLSWPPLPYAVALCDRGGDPQGKPSAAQVGLEAKLRATLDT